MHIICLPNSTWADCILFHLHQCTCVVVFVVVGFFFCVCVWVSEWVSDEWPSVWGGWGVSVCTHVPMCMSVTCVCVCLWACKRKPDTGWWRDRHWDNYIHGDRRSWHRNTDREKESSKVWLCDGQVTDAKVEETTQSRTSRHQEQDTLDCVTESYNGNKITFIIVLTLSCTNQDVNECQLQSLHYQHPKQARGHGLSHCMGNHKMQCL